MRVRVCVRALVCLFTGLCVSGSFGARRRSARSSPPSQHAAADTLPEIFNSGAAVNRAAMSHI